MDLRAQRALSNQESILAPKQARTTNPVTETLIQEEASLPPLVETSFQPSCC